MFAQEAEVRTVEGRVVRPAPFLEGDTAAVVAVPDLPVVLHRVSSTLQGPLDSARTDRDGRYRFRYRPSGGADAVYFVSALHDGIAYFTNPLRGLVTEGADAEIAVFDTTSTAFPLTVRGRHLIVGALDSLRERTVVEIFELSNDSTRTIVAPDSPDAQPTWSYPIPMAAREVKAGQGDLPADAFVQAPGRVSLYAALAPGLKQLSVTYKVPENGFPLELLIDGGAVVLEILLEEPDATVRGANLVAVEPVGLEGRQFLRFLAQDVLPGAAGCARPAHAARAVPRRHATSAAAGDHRPTSRHGGGGGAHAGAAGPRDRRSRRGLRGADDTVRGGARGVRAPSDRTRHAAARGACCAHDARVRFSHRSVDHRSGLRTIECARGTRKPV
jgi:hypothetical protein